VYGFFICFDNLNEFSAAERLNPPASPEGEADPPASPCPSAIGSASGDCRAGSHGWRGGGQAI